MTVEQTPISAGEVVAGKYRVDRVVGNGGMSVVLLAWHLELEQEVAIKVLLETNLDGGEAVERFRREARAAARIRSEHAARVLDVGTLPNGAPFIVMEYLNGNDLCDELARRGPLPVEEAVIYVLQAIDALAEAHASGIVHRDLKPENLFLTELPDGTRSVKVLDFGISKSVATASLSEASLTRTTAFVGSPLYMSPEQMRAPREVDQRTDIWSLGAVLYEAVGGRPPFSGESLAELCTRLANDTPPPLGDRRKGLPPGFETVVFRCLEKEREQRYSTVAELAAALLPFAADANYYAERAARVFTMAELATSRSGASGTGTLSRSFAPSRPPPDWLGSRANQVARDSVNAARGAPPGSWPSAALHAPRRKGALYAALALLALAGAYVLALRSGGTSGATPPPIAGASPEAVAPKPAGLAAAPEAARTDEAAVREARAETPPRPTPVRSYRAASRPQAAPGATSARNVPAVLSDSPPTPPVTDTRESTTPRLNAWDSSNFGGRH